jgi:hypothetical protein
MLRPLQRLLETIYDAPCGHDVRDFLVTERAQLPRERQGSGPQEELVLIERRRRESYLALYIDQAVLARLAQQDPLRQLDSSNIADFWTALEGVSHFSYLMWHAGHDRGVSQLELELQAEVDKYIVAWWLLRAQHPGHAPRELHRLLFERARINPQLTPAHQHLYATASRHAARFCSRLQASLLSNRPLHRGRAIAALRRFYRMGSTRKVRLIEALA